MTFKMPEMFRVKDHGGDETCGAFKVGHIACIASSGCGWEHVSVSRANRCPTWEEMAHIKNLFWEEEDAVMQLHPPKSKYVNTHPFCLHLWRPKEADIPLPPTILV